ncbi:hypothetical protein D3C86_1639730 [compost metagenome]
MALVAVYDVVLMIEPDFCRAMTGMTCLAHRNMPLRLTDISRSQSCSSIVTTFPVRPKPALLTSTSIRPKRATVVSTNACTSALIATLQPIAVAPISSAVACAASTFTSATMTEAPFFANIVAMALPMPLAAPVTMHTLFSSSIVVIP